MSRYNAITIETDILVVGHGLAGLSAAHAIKDANPDVKVLSVDKGSLGYAGKANKGGGHVAFIPDMQMKIWLRIFPDCIRQGILTLTEQPGPGRSTPPGRNRGFGLLNAVYTASIAGPAAVKYIANIDDVAIDQTQAERLLAEMFAPLERMEGTTTDEIETRIKNLMQYVPYSNFKKEDRLRQAMAEVEKLKEEVKKVIAVDFHGLAKAHACGATVLSAEMFYKGSIERKETRGWHIREDYTQRNDKNMLKWIYFEKGKDGEMVMGADPIPMDMYKYRPEDYRE